MDARISILIILSCMVFSVYGQETNVLEIRTIAITPYGIDGNTSSSGIYYDTANLLVNEAGYQANNYIYPYARIIFELKTGQTDLTIMFKYKELEDHVIYIAPLPTLKTVVIGLHGTSFDSLNDLKGKKLAYLRGAKFSDKIDRDSEIITVETKNFVQSVRMLMYGRVDAIIGPIDPMLSSAAQLNKNGDLFGVPLVVSERTPWIQLSKKSVDKVSVEKLQAAFDTIESRGELTKIRHKYVNDSHVK